MLQTKTRDDWVCILENKSLSFLLDQATFVGNKNGPHYFEALCCVIREKRAQGLEEKPRVPKRKIHVLEDEVINGKVEMVKCGGKGQYMRIIVPNE